jgi:membrane protein DedA with SNARE-associated domain
MGDWVFELLRGFFVNHGYLTVFCALLLENAGIPVPGETILLFASFLAFDEGDMRLPYIICIGIVACTTGDNIGYWIGRRGGRPLLEKYQKLFKISDRNIERGERLFDRFGSVTIFFARFVFGMRIIAGPLAGVLRMRWSRFALFNFLGATVWVTVVSIVGYMFGEHWNHLVRFIGRANLILFVIAIGVATIALRRYFERERTRQRNDLAEQREREEQPR